SYYDNLEAARHALMAGEPLPLDPKTLAAQSVQALDSINGLLVTVFDEAMIHSKRLATNALGGLAIGFVILAWSIVVVILSPIMLRRSVFGPIGDVMAKLRVACDTRVSDEDGGNELMVLARTADRLIMEVREEQQKSRQMKQLADTDALTALLSRRAFMEQAAAKRKESGVLGRPWSMAMFDLDHFKTVNDRYGHAAGDQALVHFSSVLSKGLRASDLACRYGGEEFAVFLSDAGETKAMAVLERIRIALEQSSFVFSGTSISFTVSAGMYAARYDDQLELALNRADHALYEAKAAGRNKTIAWKHVG
ncbi:MAG TPA: GGDEF domain-containing protein, partial [Spirochaetales bacterium]|nr:GGDEF domain-containing protein [Spirochaetales bacterium]